VRLVKLRNWIENWAVVTLLLTIQLSIIMLALVYL